MIDRCAILWRGQVWSLPVPARHMEVSDHITLTLGETTDDKAVYGYLTDERVFLDRVQAAKVAWRCGQTSEQFPVLASEHIWP